MNTGGRRNPRRPSRVAHLFFSLRSGKHTAAALRTTRTRLQDCHYEFCPPHKLLLFRCPFRHARLDNERVPAGPGLPPPNALPITRPAGGAGKHRCKGRAGSPPDRSAPPAATYPSTRYIRPHHRNNTRRPD